jgi:hypothetical protein
MFIDTIEERYPDRALLGIDLGSSGFKAFFALPDDHRLKIDISAHVYNQNVYEIVQETDRSRVYLSQADHYSITEDEASIPLLLKNYLQIVIGNLEEHTYEHSFVGLLLQFLVEREQ